VAATGLAFSCAVVVAAACDSGCSFVPKAKVDECHRVTQTLRADNSRLKDVTADLRAQNQELTQRAVDDAHKISAQEEAVERLEKSVTAYQAERDQLARAFEAIKRQIRLAASPQPSAALEQRLRDFAAPRAPAGWAYDPATGVLSVAAEALFEPGSARLKPEAGDELKALGDAVKESVAAGQDLEVVGRPAVPSEGVRRAGFSNEDGGGAKDTDDSTEDAEKPSPGRFLATATAARVRQALVAASGLDPGRVRLVPPTPSADAGRPFAPGGGLRVELRPVPATLDAGDATGR
jgi:chemotaxis protein MotB